MPYLFYNFFALTVGSPSAVDDILNNPRYQGAISSISWLTKICDSAFSAFISFVAFFIMSSAVGRNVVAGAYAAWPKLFDRVAEIKQDLITLADQKVAANYSPIVKFFIGFIPDFKSISEFQDDTVQPRDYFIKAIPQMFGVVMIGVVIYNGYYRDVMSKAANFGSTLITRALISIDPISVFDTIVASTGDPGFASESDNTDTGKDQLKLSKALYSSTVSFYNDISGDKSKTTLANSIESWVKTSVLTPNATYLDSKLYTMTYQVDRVYNGAAEDNVTTSSSSDTLYHIVEFMKPMADFKVASNVHTGETWSLRLIISFKTVAQGVTANSSSASLVASFGSNVVSTATGGSDVVVDLTTAESSGGSVYSIFKAGSPSISYNGTSYTVTLSTDGSTMTIVGFGSVYSSLNGASVTLTGASSLDYGDGAQNYMKVSQIILNNQSLISTLHDTGGQELDANFGAIMQAAK